MPYCPKGCVIDETEQANINQLQKEGECAVDEHRERLQKIINAGAASHQSKLERIREEVCVLEGLHLVWVSELFIMASLFIR